MLSCALVVGGGSVRKGVGEGWGDDGRGTFGFLFGGRRYGPCAEGRGGGVGRTIAPPRRLPLQFIDLVLYSFVTPLRFAISLDQDTGYLSCTEAVIHMRFNLTDLKW